MDSHCGTCGAEFEPDDRFCDQCGAPRDGVVVEAAESSGDGAGSSTGSGSKPIAALVAAALLGVVPLGFVFLMDCGDVEGSLVVKGGPHGDFIFTPQGCGSLQPYGRMGANVHAGGPHEGGVYVSRDLTRASTPG